MDSTRSSRPIAHRTVHKRWAWSTGNDSRQLLTALRTIRCHTWFPISLSLQLCPPSAFGAQLWGDPIWNSPRSFAWAIVWHTSGILLNLALPVGYIRICILQYTSSTYSMAADCLRSSQRWSIVLQSRVGCFIFDILWSMPWCRACKSLSYIYLTN